MTIQERMADTGFIFKTDEDKKPTEYYIGDLCYVMHDCWEEVCNLTYPEDGPAEGIQGEFTLADGRQFFLFNTAFGDGIYNDQDWRTYMVDSGTLGAIRVSDIKDAEGLADVKKGNYAHFHTFDYELIPDECHNLAGIITLGEIEIDTAGEDDEEMDEEEDEFDD